MTTRRSLLIALGAAALAVPRGALAQPKAKIARIGFLYFGSRQSAVDTGRYDAFVQGMRELGYVEGANFIIQARFADGKIERLPGLVAELVRLPVDVIVATGTPVYRTLQHATTTIPVVATVASDPVADGWAASMARPGGNITGLSVTAADLGPKLVELLKATVPRLARVAVLLQAENPAHPQQLKRTMAAAQKVGIQIVLAEAGTPQEIPREFETMTKEQARAVIVLPDPMFLQEARLIAAQALKHRLPTGSVVRDFAEAGLLVSYGPSVVDNFRRAAAYVDKILKGAKPGDLPIEEPTRFELVINLKTARGLGLTMSPVLVQRADRVIE